MRKVPQPHLNEKETEAQSCSVTCSRTHHIASRWLKWNPNPGALVCQAQAFSHLAILTQPGKALPTHSASPPSPAGFHGKFEGWRRASSSPVSHFLRSTGRSQRIYREKPRKGRRQGHAQLEMRLGQHFQYQPPPLPTAPSSTLALAVQRHLDKAVILWSRGSSQREEKAAFPMSQPLKDHPSGTFSDPHTSQ